MPEHVLTQLRALRESIADALRKDPRYLTLTALDKTIAEIDGVLRRSGVTTNVVRPPEPLQFDAAPGTPKEATPLPSATEPAMPQHAFAEALPDAPTAQVEAHALDAPAEPEPEAVPGEPEDNEFKGDELQNNKLEEDEPKETSLEAPAGLMDTAHSQHQYDEFAEGDDPEEPADAVASEAETFPTTHHAAPEPELSAFDDEISTPEHDAPLPVVMEHATANDASGDTPDPVENHFASSEAGYASGATDPEQNYHVTDEDESVALALGATGSTEPVVADSHAPQSEEAMDLAFEQTALAQETFGYIPMQAKLGAAIYQPAMSVKFGKLPNKVDLRPLMAPVEERPAAGSGVAQTVTGAYEYWIRKASKQDRPLSRTFVYYNARWRAGATDSDEGATIQFALEGLIKFGACAEAAWPGEDGLVFARPGGDSYRDAAGYKIHDMAHVPLRIDAWKQALAEGKPIMFGCATFDGFESCANQGGIVLPPSARTVAEEPPRLRPLCAVGYSESERVFIVRANEGSAFGDNGYCYMPFDYLMSQLLNDGDCWVFIPKVPSQPPREVWSDDKAPVTNGGAGVTFAIDAPLPIEYQSIDRDLFGDKRQPFRTEAPDSFTQYVALAGRGAWDEMEPNDAGFLLAATTLEGGMATLASAFPGAAGGTQGDVDDGLPPNAFVARRQQA